MNEGDERGMSEEYERPRTATRKGWWSNAGMVDASAGCDTPARFHAAKIVGFSEYSKLLGQ